MRCYRNRCIRYFRDAFLFYEKAEFPGPTNGVARAKEGVSNELMKEMRGDIYIYKKEYERRKD